MKNNKLKELRTKNELSCKALENETDISAATISRYENCKIGGQVNVWKTLADYFGVSFDYLVGWED
ncbi:helix-turn-helix domain-containing protein [Fructobacillus cardui]|uniref:helix-turn-helix domain-containing protein n=1 Tax=Fructobacillus cardui TaxID=2893170 RepID=UPI00200A3A1F|nr:helix-turn-helix transcriptional regulator [Fructobacillus cardui]MCK8628172.1 helix-turn-helix transcriptional regulator [Fructobacillus cardui]